MTTSHARLRKAMMPGEDGRPPVISREEMQCSLGKLGLNPAAQLLENLGITCSLDGELGSIRNAEARQSLEKAFNLSERLVGYLGFSSPTPEQMADVGVDFHYLAKQFERMKKEEGVAPHVVLAPHGLGKQNWLTIAREMTVDKTIPNNPLKVEKSKHGDRYGLWVDSGITYNVWRCLDESPTSTTTPELSILPTYVHRNDVLDVKWTLRLISGKNQPAHLNKSYYAIQKQDPPIHSQTLPEGLTDKLTAILDGSTSTNGYTSWCWQPVDTAGYAPSIGWRDDLGQIFIYWTDDSTYSSPALGSRDTVG
jgi:hypothetical protein